MCRIVENECVVRIVTTGNGMRWNFGANGRDEPLNLRGSEQSSLRVETFRFGAFVVANPVRSLGVGIP